MFILNLCLKVATYFTIVAACNNALTGVGAFIASEAKHVNQIDLIYLLPQ
jgi:predicted small secreted protein